MFSRTVLLSCLATPKPFLILVLQVLILLELIFGVSSPNNKTRFPNQLKNPLKLLNVFPNNRKEHMSFSLSST